MRHNTHRAQSVISTNYIFSVYLHVHIYLLHICPIPTCLCFLSIDIF